MAKNKQEKPDLIPRQELLQVITDHTAKLGGTAPLQTAVLAWVKQLVQAMPAKAVLVDVVRCGECVKWKPQPHPQCPTLGKCCRKKGSYRSSDDFCGSGRRADHGKE